MASDDHAIVVGITKYPEFEDLDGPENDARRFREWLIDPAGGSVPEANVRTVFSQDHFNPDDDPLLARPTMEQIEFHFNKLVQLARENRGRAGRRLYVFLAGHGFGPNRRESALLVANSNDRDRIGYHLPGQTYLDGLIENAFFDEVVLFMDCCRDIFRNATVRTPPWSTGGNTAGGDVRFFYGFATKWSRKAREHESTDGQAQGIFTEALLAALKGGILNETGQLTGRAIKDYIHTFLGQKGGIYAEQEPEMGGHDDFVMLENRVSANTPVQIDFTSPITADSRVEILGDQFRVVEANDSPGDNWTVALESGTYMVRIVGTSRDAIFDVVGQELIHVEV